MPQRLGLQSLGQAIDFGIFGAACAVITGQIFGLSVSEAGAVITGFAALLVAIGRAAVAIGRAAKYFAEARLTIAEAKVKENISQPDYYERLRDLVCFGAGDCLERKTEPDNDD